MVIFQRSKWQNCRLFHAKYSWCDVLGNIMLLIDYSVYK